MPTFTTKKGNKFNHVPQKWQSRKCFGYYQVLHDREARGGKMVKSEKYKQKTLLLTTLAVQGTLDELRSRGMMGISKTIRKEHPIDKGYYKEVKVLSDHGKWLLKMKRRKLVEKNG